MEYSREVDIGLILNSIYNGIVSINEEGIITYFNKTAERIFNIPFHEAFDQYILDVLPNTGSKLLECLETGRPLYGEQLKGEKVTLISNINPVVNDGKISGVVSVFQDISEIEKISKELGFFKNMKNWLDAIIDSSYDGLWICDHEARVVRINKAAEKMHNIRAEEVLGKNMKELITNSLLDKSVTLEALKRKATVTMIQKIKGEKKILVTSNPIFNEKGEIGFIVSNDRDISELDNLRRQLEETQALAKRYSSKLSELEMSGVDLSNIVFRSRNMESIIELSLKVGDVDSTVLLLGESGVGKGMIAKLIHKHSGRSHGPFMRVDCAGIPDSLIESELFGYEKGAFTGANPRGKIGFFELADRGTLFLDEIGEMPLSSQSKLLRFLESHEITRVGGTESRNIDVRIIAATNKNMEEMIKTKLFREDLYYRVNVVPIRIPPLRERKDDILPLLFYFLDKYNKAYHKKKMLSSDAVDALCKYDFPGNVREVANLVERLVVVSEDDYIGTNDLPSPVVGHISDRPTDPLFSTNLGLKQVLGEYESSIIRQTIQKYGSQQKAAKVLKVDQATLSRKIRKYLIGR